MCSKHVEAWNKLIVKQKFCASSYRDKYTEMHGQQKSNFLKSKLDLKNTIFIKKCNKNTEIRSVE